MKYDDIYEHIGQMGRFQMCACAAIFFFSFFALDAVNMIFIGADMAHWCADQPPGLLANTSLQEHLTGAANLSIEHRIAMQSAMANLSNNQKLSMFAEMFGLSGEQRLEFMPQGFQSQDFDSCQVHWIVNASVFADILSVDDIRVGEESQQDGGDYGNGITVGVDFPLDEEMEKERLREGSEPLAGVKKRRDGKEKLKGLDEGVVVIHSAMGGECSSWEYDRSTFVSSVVSRFDLVCRREHLNQFASTLFMIGSVVGGVVSGVLADKLGRRTSLLLFLIIKTGGLLGSALSPSYLSFAAGRLVLGIGSSASFVNAYILLMEIVGPRYRSFAGCGIQVATSVGFMIQPVIAMATRHDVSFQLAFLAPNVIVFIFVLIVPESPRWLIVVGRHAQAERVFKQMCRVNKTSLPVGFDVRKIEKEDGPQKGYAILLSYRRMRLRSIVMNVIWFTSNLVYYAMALNVGYLPGDIFINTILSAGLEVPAIIVCVFLLDWAWLGRKGCAILSFLLSGVALFLCIPMELIDYGVAVTSLNIVGKASAVITYSVLFVYASEIFPTEVRNAAMGVAQMFACIGSVAAPYVGKPMAELWRPLPYLVLGVTAVLSGLACLPLPETLAHPLCDTVEQAESFLGGKSKYMPKAKEAAPPIETNENGVHNLVNTKSITPEDELCDDKDSEAVTLGSQA